jgi:hypothetical protein
MGSYLGLAAWAGVLAWTSSGAKTWRQRLPEIANLRGNALAFLCAAFCFLNFDRSSLGGYRIGGKSKQSCDDGFVRHGGDPL